MSQPFRIHSSMMDHPSVLHRMGNDHLIEQASLPEGEERDFHSQMLYSNWSNQDQIEGFQVGYFIADMVESRRCWGFQYKDISPIEAPVFHIGDSVSYYDRMANTNALGYVVSKRLKLIGEYNPTWRWLYEVEWDKGTPFVPREFTSSEARLTRSTSNEDDPRTIQERLRDALDGKIQST